MAKSDLNNKASILISIRKIDLQKKVNQINKYRSVIGGNEFHIFGLLPSSDFSSAITTVIIFQSFTEQYCILCSIQIF